MKKFSYRSVVIVVENGWFFCLGKMFNSEKKTFCFIDNSFGEPTTFNPIF